MSGKPYLHLTCYRIHPCTVITLITILLNLFRYLKDINQIHEIKMYSLVKYGALLRLRTMVS